MTVCGIIHTSMFWVLKYSIVSWHMWELVLSWWKMLNSWWCTIQTWLFEAPPFYFWTFACTIDTRIFLSLCQIRSDSMTTIHFSNDKDSFSQWQLPMVLNTITGCGRLFSSRDWRPRLNSLYHRLTVLKEAVYSPKVEVVWSIHHVLIFHVENGNVK